MLKLARRYAQRPIQEWKPLFYRILQNRVRDCQRRRQVRSGIFGWLPHFDSSDEEAVDPAHATPDERAGVIEQLMADQAVKAMEPAIAALPVRQQQAFLLRTFEGLDIAQTAVAMGCSEGSVKTHYSRAVHALRGRLGDMW